MKHKKLFLALVPLLGLLLAGCGEKKAEVGNAAAKVNGTSISVAELDSKMKQYSHYPAEQKSLITGTILKALVDTELLRQAALGEKLDQDEQVRLKLAQANRLILANAYVEKQRATIAKPSAEEVKAYFDKHPELYGDRKIYELRELVIQPKPANEAEILAKLGDGRKFDEFTRWLTENKIPHGSRPQVVAPDNIPEDILAKLYKQEVGTAMVINDASRISILHVDGHQPQPTALDKATPAIEAKMVDQGKVAAMDATFKKLREKAKIEYVAPYSEKGIQAPAQP